MGKIALVIIVLVFPLAVAGQNIGAGIATLFLGLAFAYKRSELGILTQLRPVAVSLSLALAYLMTLIIATAANPASPGGTIPSIISSHLIWLLLPALLVVNGPYIKDTLLGLNRAALAVATVFGILAVSQAIVPWQMVGAAITTGTSRARGLYSHPLTFAYAVIWLWPFVIAQVFNHRRSKLSWSAFFGIAAALLLSESRTVLAGAAVILAYNIYGRTQGRMRMVLAGLCAATCLSIVIIPNPLGEKIRATYSSDGFDRNSSYRDDRLAFWHAHWIMFKERPVLGHGADLNTNYLEPYYAAIGLTDLKKKYPAHNTFLQIAVNSGLVGLGTFLAWYWSLAAFAWRRRNDHWAYPVFLQAWATFALISLTQNSFQDSEVRYGMTLAVGALWIGSSLTAYRSRSDQE